MVGSRLTKVSEPQTPLTASIRRHGTLLIVAVVTVGAAALVFGRGVTALRLPPDYLLSVLFLGYSLHGAVSTVAVLKGRFHRWPRLLALHGASLLFSLSGSYLLVRLTVTVFNRF